jgi:D-arabinose 1-dehydrogenase-like Zn-dependent alcohol dehydrogenase
VYYYAVRFFIDLTLLGLGHFGVQWAHAMGAKTVAYDIVPEKAADSKVLGCDDYPRWPPRIKGTSLRFFHSYLGYKNYQQKLGRLF